MRTNKFLYGFLAIGPFIGILLGILIFAMLFGFGSIRNGDAEAFLIVFFVFIVLASITSLVSLIMYIIHISRSPYIPENTKIGWIVGIVFANGIVNIIYYFMYIWNEEQHEADLQSRKSYIQGQNQF